MVSNLQAILKWAEIVLWESFLQNTFSSVIEELYSNTISEEQVCLEPTVLIVIYYREAKKPKVCKHCSRIEETCSGTYTHIKTGETYVYSYAHFQFGFAFIFYIAICWAMSTGSDL